MVEFTQAWFEMADIRQKNYDKSVWIPLRAVNTKLEEGNYGHVGFVKDFFGSGSIAVPSEKIENAMSLGWMDIGISHNHSGYVDESVYYPAENFSEYHEKVSGVHLVLSQDLYDNTPLIWHLNQDLVVTLRLKREGDDWVCPGEGYELAAKLVRDETGRPSILEIKAKYLKDYLCARNMALYMTHYCERRAIVSESDFIGWENGKETAEDARDRWEGRVNPIHEGGNPFDSGIAVFHVSRTDVNEAEDVPDISGPPTGKGIKSEKSFRKFKGRKLFSVSGCLWRNEVINPGKNSPIVRGDRLPSNVSFIVDAEGAREQANELVEKGKWLWFTPDVIMALAHKRGGSLSFYTAHTGEVGALYGYGVHFGVNDLGLVNVYAKDVCLLPEWQQRIWAGYNVYPEGGVSSELMASQVNAKPADTLAPEEFLMAGIDLVNQHSQEKLGIFLFRDHEAMESIIEKTHRFRAIDEYSVYALAKDLARLTVDSLDAKSMQSIVPPQNKEKLGSLKSLENLLSSRNGNDLVREITAPLVGVYELRHADAHLPSAELENAFELVGVDRSSPYVYQGYQILYSVVSSLYGIVRLLEQWKDD